MWHLLTQYLFWVRMFQYRPDAFLSVRQSVRQRPLEIPGKMNIPLWHDAAVKMRYRSKGPLFIAASDITQLDGMPQKHIKVLP